MKKGYRCRANTGGFVWGNGKWKFIMKADFPTTAKGWNMGFCQLMVIKDGAARPISSKMRLKKTIYRALCENTSGTDAMVALLWWLLCLCSALCLAALRASTSMDASIGPFSWSWWLVTQEAAKVL